MASQPVIPMSFKTPKLSNGAITEMLSSIAPKSSFSTAEEKTPRPPLNPVVQILDSRALPEGKTRALIFDGSQSHHLVVFKAPENLTNPIYPPMDAKEEKKKDKQSNETQQKLFSISKFDIVILTDYDMVFEQESEIVVVNKWKLVTPGEYIYTLGFN